MTEIIIILKKNPFFSFSSAGIYTPELAIFQITDQSHASY